MKDLMVRTHTFTMLTSRLAAIVVFAALLFAVPSHAALAATAPSLGAASGFTVLSAAPGGGGAVTCTDSIITGGDVGSSGLPAAVVQTRCSITGAIIAPVSAGVLTDFNNAYDALTLVPCDATLTGTLAGVTLTPGVYCFDAAATLTGILTLNGGPNDIWIFKIGTKAVGALTGTDFSVVMANGGQPCNVYWWVEAAATMTRADFKGTILAGAAITVTGGTFTGRALAKAAVTFTGVVPATGCGGGSSQCTVLQPSSSRSEFNGTSIPGGSSIWFSANASIKGIPTNDGAQTVWFTDQVITVPGVGTFDLPATEVTFSPISSCASVSFNPAVGPTGTWGVDVPFSGSDEIFIGGFILPVPAGLPGGIKNVTWSGTLLSTVAGASMNWKWGAAVYTPPLPADLNALQVKPTHKDACAFDNSDHAGTPEAFKSSVIGGARGGGGSNFTGSWSGTANVKPPKCP